MNSAVSAYSSHSYYGSSDNLSAAGHSAVGSAPTSWSYAPQSNGLLGVFDPYSHGSSSGVSTVGGVSTAGAVADYYGSTYPHPPVLCRYPSATVSTGASSPHGFNNSNWANPAAAAAAAAADQIYSQLTANYPQYQPGVAGKKRGVGNSKKERRRTISINGAFSNLRDCIPNVPKDTKLSKIKTLRLACGYIQHLMDALVSDTPVPLHEFKADLSRKTPCRAEKRKCIEAEIAAAADRKCRGRSGWPQTIWAQDLKTDGASSDATSHPYLSINNSASSHHEKLSNGSRESCASSFDSASSNIENMERMDPSPSYHSSICEESPAPSIAGSLG